MRDHLAHGYFDINTDLAWSVITEDIEPLKVAVEWCQSLSLFGFIAAGSGLEVSDTQLTNASAVIAFAPRWYLYVFMIMILSGQGWKYYRSLHPTFPLPMLRVENKGDKWKIDSEVRGSWSRGSC